MTNCVDPDRTAPMGAVRSGSTLFASILKFVSNVRLFVSADDFIKCVFLGALRVKLRPILSWSVGCCQSDVIG